MAEIHDLLECMSCMGISISACDDRLLYWPRSAMTPDVLEAVRNSKFELLELLSATGSKSKADIEFDRFERVAKPMPGGGWYDPIHGTPEMPTGILGEQWDAFVADCGNLGRKKKNTKGGGIQTQSRIIGVTNRGETT